MVLSNIEIWAELTAKRMVFDPPIPRERIDRSSVDLLLHEELIILPTSMVQNVIVEPPTEGSMDVMKLLTTHGEKHSLADHTPYKLVPHHLVIGKTMETMSLPPHIAGRIEGKSTLARLGLAIHVTAPTVIAGFEGRLYLEIHNIGPFQINLSQGMRIAQLVLERTGLPPDAPYEGYFRSQT